MHVLFDKLALHFSDLFFMYILAFIHSLAVFLKSNSPDVFTLFCTLPSFLIPECEQAQRLVQEHVQTDPQEARG